MATERTVHSFEDFSLPAGRFLNADDRAQLDGCALSISSLVLQPKARFGARWLATAVVLATGEQLLIGLSNNDARQAIFGGIQAALDAGDAIAPVVLYRAEPVPPATNSYWTFRTATDDEVEAPKAPEFADDDDGETDDPAAVAAAGPRLKGARK
jgi:hypothetical protein